jgi:hypothetical protein
MPDSQIDEVAADTHLRHDLIAMLSENISRWEDNQIAVVELLVGKRDDAVVLRTVMPPQTTDRLPHAPSALRGVPSENGR